jgi:ribonuclease T2
MLRCMKRRMIAVLAGVALALVGCGPHGQSADGTNVAADKSQRMVARGAAAGGGFDFYLLNLSWSPEFCHSHPDAAECAEHARFVLHGLWPENMDGTYPENCSTAPGPTNPAEYADIYPEAGLLEHEWRTHGTCSGLSADAFFAAARTAYRAVRIPTELNALAGRTSMTPEAIAGAFSASNAAIARADVVVSCGHNYLTAVEVCLDKSLQPMACPALRACRANTVRILAP